MFNLQFERPWRRYGRPVQYGLIIAFLITVILITGASAEAADKKPLQEKYQAPNRKWTGDFDGMLKDRVIRAVVAYSKTFYFLDQGRQRGLAYDLLKEFEKFINKKYKKKNLQVHVVFYPVPRDKLVEYLVGGLGDIAIANLTITPERQKQVDFSDPMQTGVKELLVTGPAAPALNSIDDLAGQKIHVRKSSSYYESLVDLNASFKKNGKPQIKLIATEEIFEDEDLLEMVNAGLIPMIVMDSHKAHFWTQIFEKIKVHDEIALREGGEIAWAFRKNSPKLKAIVNEFVKGHKKGTMLGNMLLKRYLQSTRYVKNALDDKELQKFSSMVAIFKKYAGKYDFDYLMIAALAYQESGLDQSKRSHAGAVGVMQILPSTAADPNIGIAGIEKRENNIHAGTKYLRFIIDRYYGEEPMNDGNKKLFGLASYNAGPARVRGLRQKAVAMGLDPNLWFYNVEVAAAQEIGRETVQYVSNIYKYYIVYQSVFSQLEKKEQLRKKNK
ncbi:transglycosylase SLT domain-containing protein [Thermodesulfobacteriota bacterium]